MKIITVFIAVIFSRASAFAPLAHPHQSTSLNAEDVPLANGAMSFNRVCREWRCKYEGDKGSSESLEAISKVVDELLPEIKKISKDVKVNRLVCGACKDFKLMTTVPLDDFGPWEEK